MTRIEGVITGSGSRRGCLTGPAETGRLFLLPTESPRLLLQRLDGRPHVTGYAMPSTNPLLRYPRGPAQRWAQARYRTYLDRELRRRGFAPTGVDARGRTRYARPRS